MKRWIGHAVIWTLCVQMLSGCLGFPSKDETDPVSVQQVSDAGDADVTNKDNKQAQAAVEEPGSLSSVSPEDKGEVPKEPVSAPREPAKEGTSEENKGNAGEAGSTKNATAQKAGEGTPQEVTKEAPKSQQETVVAPAPVEPKEEASVKEAELKGKAEEELVKLKGYYEGQINGLLNEAVAAKKSGKSNQETLNQYLKKALALQEDSEAKVNQILFQLKQELAKNNLPTAGVDELRSAYNAEIDKKQESVTVQAKSLLSK